MLNEMKFLLLTLALAAIATTTLAGTGDDTASGVFSDAAFLKKAAMAGHAEVVLGNIAVQKSAVPAVQEFAGRMVQEHGQQALKLKRVAASVGVRLPKTADAKFSAAIARFEQLQGPMFDAEYAVAIVSDHHMPLRQFRSAATEASAPEVRAFAREGIPVLETHLLQAEALLHQVKVASAAGAGGVRVHQYFPEPSLCPTYY